MNSIYIFEETYNSKLMKNTFHQNLIVTILFINISFSLTAQNIPVVLSGLQKDAEGNIFLMTEEGDKLVQVLPHRLNYTLTQMQGDPVGTEKGIDFNFQRNNFHGMVFYGLIHYNDSKHPIPVYRSSPARIISGKTSIDFDQLRGRYDMTGWEESGKGTIGYRVIDNRGAIIYDGIISFSGTGPFHVINSIQTGPFVNLVHPGGVSISFVTSEESICKVSVDGQSFEDASPTKRHEIKIDGLEADRTYNYTLHYGTLEQSYSFKTSPLPGSRKKFIFSYSSDSRGGSGWGERNLYGANVYVIKKIMAVGASNNIAFAQFTGDLISGYSTNKDHMRLQYHNWQNAVTPFGHHFPVIFGMGNHESYNMTFQDSAKLYSVSLDRFPYKDDSSESLFAEVAVNPHNGPKSEDGSSYDPDPGTTDFPSYDENVFYYTYDNVAVITLNSNYWYTPNTGSVPFVGGNIHGYVMDMQLKWFKKTLKKLEKDNTIDHIFVTIHTPFFPNGGHVYDDMWYNGDNTPRPYIAGKAVEKGIIERRDQLLNLAINKSDKVVAFLTGDEHNYCKTEIHPKMNIYPENYSGKKIKLSRTIYQINNGAAGAPYYAQQETPWTPYTSGFTTQNAVCMFTVDGNSVSMIVINPDTLEEIDKLKLK